MLATSSDPAEQHSYLMTEARPFRETYVSFNQNETMEIVKLM
jgi:hypothetical protein